MEVPLEGGWGDFPGELPAVVIDAVRDTLTNKENLEVASMNCNKLQSQVCVVVRMTLMRLNNIKVIT